MLTVDFIGRDDENSFCLSCFFEQKVSRPANSGYALAELQLLRPRNAYALNWIS